jgi:acetoin utilization deacetylase AcuC-like enzyme
LCEIHRHIPESVSIRRPIGATPVDLLTVHDEQYVRRIAALAASGEEVAFLTADTYLSPGSYETALFAAGSAIAAARQALHGEHCFALVRPPGHHATRNRAMGYCIFNNAAIAAATALKGEISRVAILDWDLHHGNGTQEIFYTSDQVLFCSVHLQGAFPGSGWVDEIGEKEGRGFTMNAPLVEGATIADLVHVLNEGFGPAIDAFDPDLLIVSAGQDGLADDPKAGMALIPDDYGLLAALAADIARGPIALVLEGGYGPSQQNAIRCIFEGLLGRVPDLPETDPRPSTRTVVQTLKRLTG